MNLIQLNKLINQLTIENVESNNQLISFYKAKRLELLKQIETTIKLKLYATN